ncbi:Uncharacterized protein DBV15_01164, partial [Temnothorax longispinosus]
MTLPVAMPRYPRLAEDVASRDEDDKDREKREIGSRTSRELASHSQASGGDDDGGSGSYLHWKFRDLGGRRVRPRRDKTFPRYSARVSCKRDSDQRKAEVGKNFALVLAKEGCKDLGTFTYAESSWKTLYCSSTLRGIF